MEKTTEELRLENNQRAGIKERSKKEVLPLNHAIGKVAGYNSTVMQATDSLRALEAQLEAVESLLVETPGDIGQCEKQFKLHALIMQTRRAQRTALESQCYWSTIVEQLRGGPQPVAPVAPVAAPQEDLPF